jgi:hypothetical protein
MGPRLGERAVKEVKRLAVGRFRFAVGGWPLGVRGKNHLRARRNDETHGGYVFVRGRSLTWFVAAANRKRQTANPSPSIDRFDGKVQVGRGGVILIE